MDPAYSPVALVAPNPCAAGCTRARYCGDAIQDPEEVCDDGNNLDGDGCSGDCKHTERRVFVSSAVYKGDLNSAQNNPQNLAGLTLADARCQALAVAAALPGTYRAWLANSTGAPANRFDITFTGLYRLVSPGHPIVATAWKGLISPPLQHAIDADETGASPNLGKTVWTNTLPTGTKASDLHCKNWSSINNADTTTLGIYDNTDPKWTNTGAGQLCPGESRLYCFEDA